MDIRNPDIWDYHPQFYRIYHPTVDLFSQRKRERADFLFYEGYIFLKLSEITLLKTGKKQRILQEDKLIWVEEEREKRLKAKMKRNTAEIR